MGREVSFDYSKAAGFVNQEELDNLKGYRTVCEGHPCEQDRRRK